MWKWGFLIRILYVSSHKYGKTTFDVLPMHMRSQISTLNTSYHNFIPNQYLEKTTYHTWVNDASLDVDIYKNIKTIQNNDYWRVLCDNPENCILQNANQMDEIYYSNPPAANLQTTFLYGTVSNHDIHTDAPFWFRDIYFYRVIIGLTENNENVITRFPKTQEDVKIQKYEYIAFDYSRTPHQVVTVNNRSNSRILLKLHFLVCDNCTYSQNQIHWISKSFVGYNYAMRLFTNAGIDPKTFDEFYIGLLCELFYRHRILCCLFWNINVLAFIEQIWYSKYTKNKYLHLAILAHVIYLFVVMYFTFAHHYNLINL